LHGTHKYGSVSIMKTTLEIPDRVFRRAKVQAARQGHTLRQFVTEALEEKLTPGKEPGAAGRPWMELFGAGRKHGAALREIDRVIEEEFGQIEPEDWK
jgi:hypothetical protein